jgi:predicted transposase/invertase (TIGR01784 family)
MQFVDIKNDIAFRKIFGNEKRKVILISFLNAIMQLEGDNRIVEITIANPFQMPILPNLKASIIDVKAIDGNGKTYIVEMQVADVIGMDKRLLYYTSKEYSQQIAIGEQYTELNPVIFIGIFEFHFTEGEYLSHHAICNVKTGERIIKDMDFYFIELPKFQKELVELNNVTDKWIYFIKEAENLEVIPDNIDDEGLKEAYQDANKNTWTKEELDAYDYAGMREQDVRGRMQKAEQKAEQKGEQRGEQRGIEQGRKTREVEIAKGMKTEGIPLGTIAKLTGLSEEEIENL